MCIVKRGDTMRFKKIKYRVQCKRWSGNEYFEVVEGYAVDQDKVPFKFCVRKDRHEWVIDDWVTGYNCGFGKTRAEAIQCCFNKASLYEIAFRRSVLERIKDVVRLGLPTEELSAMAQYDD